jgi:hypothetical protein
VIHAFADKAKQEIRDKQAKKAKKAKDERHPEDECEAAKYRDPSQRECAPVTAIKKSFISAATAMDNLTKGGAAAGVVRLTDSGPRLDVGAD